MYSIADKTLDRGNMRVFWWIDGCGFTPRKTWKTSKGAEKGIVKMFRECSKVSSQILEVVLVGN